MTPNKRGRIFMLTTAIVIAALFLANIAFGSVSIPIRNVLSILCGDDDKATWQYIVIQSRLPQAITAALCGASLAACGLMLQTAFNNPLAGPSIFGINSGASLGVAIVILLMNGSITSELLTANGFAAIFSGAMAGSALVIMLLLVCSRFVRSNVVLLIIGIMIGYISSAAISILNFFATEQGVQSYVMWGMGSFGNVTLQHIPIFSSLIILSLITSLLMAKPLNALLLGEKYAMNLGFNTKRIRGILLLITGMQTAVTTAYCGPVAFIGLAVPHITRMLLRTDSPSCILPCSILCGAAIALFCNVVCTLPADGSIIPLNAVTPIIGAPVIIHLVTRKN